jgi:uncharacterized protein YecE (DUF72 family)
MIRIGTSGWHYDHWRGPFYPEKLPDSRMLEFYIQHFDTVELNNTFYRLPSESAVEVWRESVPAGFLFAAKGSRFLTHMKKLRDPVPGQARFFERVDHLKRKLGPVVFQLPPSWGPDVPRLEEFLEALPPRHRYSFELRDPSWHIEEVYRVLRRHNVAFCVYDLAGFESPRLVTADFAYVRLHGPGANRYQGSYSDDALRGWVRRIEDWMRTLKAVYIYFDNDQAGYAVKDALALKGMVLGRVAREAGLAMADGGPGGRGHRVLS